MKVKRMTYVVEDDGMDKTKGLFDSKTFWGVVVMLTGPLFLEWFGIDLSSETGLEFANKAPELIGAFIALYGRAKASSKIDNIF